MMGFAAAQNIFRSFLFFFKVIKYDMVFGSAVQHFHCLRFLLLTRKHLFDVLEMLIEGCEHYSSRNEGDFATSFTFPRKNVKKHTTKSARLPTIFFLVSRKRLPLSKKKLTKNLLNYLIKTSDLSPKNEIIT